MVSVGAIPETTGAAYLQDQQISFGAYKTPLAGLTAITEGRIDAFVYDAPIIRYLINKEFHGKLQVLSRTFVRQDYGIALPPGSSLREPINRVLLKTIGDPKWQDVLKRYLGQ